MKAALGHSTVDQDRRRRLEPAGHASAAPPVAAVLALQRRAGNRATTRLIGVQRCGGVKCSDGCPEEQREQVPAAPVQRVVDRALGEALDAGRFPGTPAAHPPLLDVAQIFGKLSPADKRDTLRALTSGQQFGFVRFYLGRQDDEAWHAIIETVSTDARIYAVRTLMAAGRMNEPRGPWGAYGVLNGLSDGDQLAALNQLTEPERRRLQQGLTTAPIDRVRLERQLAQVDPQAVPAVRPIHFPVTWVAEELPQRAATAAGPASFMGSQGAHAVGPSNAASGMRMVRSGYWRALIPAPRAVELERVLDELPRDLDPWFSTHMRQTPPGQPPQFQWVSGRPGAMQRPFTIAELQSIPSLVRKFNANASSLTAAEAQLMSRVVSLHVGGAHRGGSPLSSWSVPPRPGQGPAISWGNSRNFKVRADFDRASVLDNTRASAANTLSPADSSFEAGLNPDEAEFLATAESDARILTVQPMRGTVRGEVVPGSAAWMSRNATSLRWAGRGLIVVSFAISGYRIATADEAQRAHVVGEEAGAQALGLAGSILAGAACVGLGIATGGVGLVLCGLAGGLLGGIAGSAIGGATADALDRSGAVGAGGPGADPFGLTAGGWDVGTAPPEILIY